MLSMETLERKTRVTEPALKPGDPGYVPPKPLATATMELITPQKAADCLERMHHNRTKSKIEKGVMSQLLRDGEFYGEISPVYFDDNGDWVAAPGDQDPWDGQHRFEAIAETGIPAWMWVIRGISEPASEYIDTGRRRIYSDTLAIQRMTDPKRQAILARAMAMYEVHGIAGIRNPSSFPLTRGQMDRWVDGPGMMESIHLANQIRHATTGSDGALSYAIRRTARVDEAGADGRATAVTIDPTGFWQSVKTGDGLERGDPAKTLREWMMRRRAEARQTRADPRLMNFYAVGTAWNKHVIGKPYRKVQPKFERKRSGEAYFPASAVPDLLPAGADPLGELRDAYEEARQA